MGFEVRAVGQVESPLTDRATAPRQGDEGAPDAWVVLSPEFAAAGADIRVGDDTGAGALGLATGAILGTAALRANFPGVARRGAAAAMARNARGLAA